MQHCKRRTFTTYEDRAIIESVQTYGENWDAVSKKLHGRTPKQCHDRYINYLRSGLKSEPWTNEEDEIVIKLYHEIGSKWSKMMSNLPGRSGNDIKNRWHKHISKKFLNISQINGCNMYETFDSKDKNIDHIISSPDDDEKHALENLMREFEVIGFDVQTKTGKIDLCAEIGWSEKELQEILEEISFNNMLDQLSKQSLYM